MSFTPKTVSSVAFKVFVHCFRSPLVSITIVYKAPKGLDD